MTARIEIDAYPTEDGSVLALAVYDDIPCSATNSLVEAREAGDEDLLTVLYLSPAEARQLAETLTHLAEYRDNRTFVMEAS